MCWIVDEDCQTLAGRRREAIFVGAVGLISSIGRAVAVGLVLNGLNLMGLAITNCEQACVSPSGSKQDCLDECARQNISRQPPGVGQYAEFMYYVVVPVCQFFTALLTWTFPIYGTRLDAIYANQSTMFEAVLVRVSTKSSKKSQEITGSSASSDSLDVGSSGMQVAQVVGKPERGTDIPNKPAEEEEQSM